MSDVKNFGLKGVGADVQLGKRGPKLKNSSGTIQARNAADAAFVNLEALDPTTAQHVATKNYVDGLLSGPLYRQQSIVFGTAITNIGAVLPTGAKIQTVKVTITTAWNDSATTLVIDNTATVFMASTNNDLLELNGTFIEETLGATTVGANTQLRAVLAGGTPSAGAATVLVEYLV